MALLACLVWGGPFGSLPTRPGGSDSSGGGGGDGDALLSEREDVSRHLEGTMDPQAMANMTEDELR